MDTHPQSISPAHGIMHLLVSTPQELFNLHPFATKPFEVDLKSPGAQKVINSTGRRSRDELVVDISWMLAAQMPGFDHADVDRARDIPVTEFWTSKLDLPTFPGVKYGCFLSIECPQEQGCLSMASAIVNISTRTIATHGLWHRPTVVAIGYVIRHNHHYAFLVMSDRAGRAFRDVLQNEHVDLEGHIMGGWIMARRPFSPDNSLVVDHAFLNHANNVRMFIAGQFHMD
ncbi:hypothetical protein PENSPDRAFT_670086 [Peniophora sp. CONT]|nr:hypothetical protein PENSPDRAFT_670086 [Peniophora sp. CONT]